MITRECRPAHDAGPDQAHDPSTRGSDRDRPSAAERQSTEDRPDGEPAAPGEAQRPAARGAGAVQWTVTSFSIWANSAGPTSLRVRRSATDRNRCCVRAAMILARVTGPMPGSA